MAENSIVKANIGVGVDGTKAKAGLQTVNQDLKKWADGTVKQLRGQFQEGFTGGLLGGFFGAHFSGLVEKGAEALARWVTNADEIEATSKRLEANFQGAKDAQDAAAKSAEKWRAGLGRTDTLSSMREELAGLSAEASRLITKAEKARLNPVKERWEDFARIMGEASLVGDSIGDLTAKIADAEKLQPLVAVRKEIERVREEMDLLGLSGDDLVDATLRRAGAIEGVSDKVDASLAKLRELRTARDTGGPLGGAFAGPLEAMLGFGAKSLLPQSAPAWLGAVLNVAGIAAEAANKPRGELKLDNAALRKGSSAEVSARARFELGLADRKAIDEAKQQNRNLEALIGVAKKLPAEIAAAVALGAL